MRKFLWLLPALLGLTVTAALCAPVRPNCVPHFSPCSANGVAFTTASLPEVGYIVIGNTDAANTTTMDIETNCSGTPATTTALTATGTGANTTPYSSTPHAKVMVTDVGVSPAADHPVGKLEDSATHSGIKVTMN